MSNELVAGAFEEHFTNRYKKHSPSVRAFEEDADTAFNSGEILPSPSPSETLGMVEDQHDLIASERSQSNQLRIDNPVMRINEDGSYEVVDQLEMSPKVDAKIVDEEGNPPVKNFNDLSFDERTDFFKMRMLDGMREKRVSRTVIDPDQVFDPDTAMNMTLKVVTEIGEGFVEGLENTARSAAILAYDTFPPTDPIGKAYADILNSNAISTTDLRAGILPDVKNAEGIGYGLLRGVAQFAPNFIAFNRALSGFSALKGANITKGFLAGMPSDALAFDSVDGNLHDLAITVGEVDIPGLGMVNFDNEYTQFMSASAQDTQAEGRFRNVVEGGLVGVAFDLAIRGAGKGFTTAQGSAYRKKFTELYVSTAKNLRDFRVDSANRLEAQGMKTLQESYKAKASTTIEMHSGLPVNEYQSKAIKALSEIALSKLMKGEVTDYKTWLAVAKSIDSSIPDTFKRQSGDGSDAVKGDKTPEMLKNQSGDGFQYNVDEQHPDIRKPQVDEYDDSQAKEAWNNAVEYQNSMTYRGVHTAPMREEGLKNTADDLSDIFPEDVYDPRVAAQYYGHSGAGDPMNNRTAEILSSMQGRPDAKITIYRAVPKGVKTINRGDWVTINEKYAKSHGDSWVENGNYKVIKKQATAKDIATDGNSIHEFGYDPQ